MKCHLEYGKTGIQVDLPERNLISIARPRNLPSIMDEEVTIPANATMIENLLTAAPETKAIFDYAGYGIPAAATVLPNLGMEHVYVGEIDGIPEEIELLASGAVLGATAQQQPYLFGKQAVEAWLTYCADPEGAELPEVIEVPTQLITNENAADFMDN